MKLYFVMHPDTTAELSQPGFLYLRVKNSFLSMLF